MIIDLSDLMNYQKGSIDIKEGIIIPQEQLLSSRIQRLSDVKFIGKINSMGDIYQLSGALSGTMILIDDVTLEDVEYSFNINIEHQLSESTVDNEDICKIFQNSIDIIPILWQNIVLEVPSKVRKDAKTYHLEGDGWQLITEEEYLNKDE